MALTDRSSSSRATRPPMSAAPPEPAAVNRPADNLAWIEAACTLAMFPSTVASQTIAYSLDAWQRSVLFLDILRRRGNTYFAHNARHAPHVLHHQFELVMNGLELERPVNYALLRMLPPAGVKSDARMRPFIIFDPRAGHGPGIGGMKADSEIGVALAAGHPCYFVGFIPEPVQGQTVEDVCRAEAAFVRAVAALHPAADGKPFLIGNCQAGWQIAMMAAMNPDLVGPVMFAGSPLSYWAGVRGKNPMRYLGGLLGGTWSTSFAGDIGHGIFDGAHLINNFEALDPANTYWQKPYNVYSKVDTEGPRFLEFETWWGSPVLLTANEMQSIADELFVGNRLSSAGIRTTEGAVVDLRNIKSPIVVFCSFGDNITPPQQALGWILDLYDDDAEIVAAGQTIVYALHQTIGHLGIFVSAKVATKEHQELQQATDLIDVLPPGLYEAVFETKTSTTASHELVSGDYVVRFEPRSLVNIRALGANDAEDDLRFATVARVSEVTQGLYRTYVSPFVRSLTSEQTAEWLRRLHPYRIRYEMFSDRNPVLWPLPAIADHVAAKRVRIDNNNFLLQCERAFSEQVVKSLDLYRDARDSFIESWFMAFYGAPPLQALVGLRADAAAVRRRAARDLSRHEVLAKSAAELDARLHSGGLREAGIRALVYVGLGQEFPSFDERGFAILREVRANTPERERTPLAEFKRLVRDQYALIRTDEDRAMSALPKLLPRDADARKTAFDLIRRIVLARGEPSSEAKRRLAQVEELFDLSESTRAAVANTPRAPTGPSKDSAAE
jgi:pimeloyl-ACP methyl ester carboxylesterase